MSPLLSCVKVRVIEHNNHQRVCTKDDRFIILIDHDEYSEYIYIIQVGINKLRSIKKNTIE